MEYLDQDDAIIPVGDFIKECLRVIDVRQKHFAAYIDWNSGNLTKLLNGSRKVNYELAMILGNTFNINPSLWLQVQDKNELMQLRRVNREKYKGYSLHRLYEVASA